jgi:glutamate synthase domain-containing protein 1
MATKDQKLKEFKSKPYEEKLKISMNIITNLKDRGNAQAQEIYDKISVMERIPDNILEAIYKDFCDSVERIQQEKVQ